MEHQRKRRASARWFGLFGLGFAILQIVSALFVFNTQSSTAPAFQWVGFLLAGWGIAFGVVGLAMLRGNPRAVVAGAWLLLLYLTVETLRIVLFAQADYDRGRIAFRVGAALLVALIPLFYLANHYRKTARASYDDGE